MAAPPAPEDWRSDPFGIHEERLFKGGQPTPLVKDNGVGSYDEPRVATQTPPPPVARVPSTPAPAPAPPTTQMPASVAAAPGQPQPPPAVDDGQDAGEGRFGDGVAKPLYEFRASRFKGGRLFTPNVIRVWPDRIEEYEHHALRKKGTQAISFHQVAQVALGRGSRWTDITVESTGGHVITLKGVPKSDGESVKKLIDDAVDAARRGPSPSALPTMSPQGSVADELMKLAQLRDAGVITAEEFESQKAKMLRPHT
jgi:hypothetical protein